MNFKKYQRRIPMNFKKIIPLTFTALCIAGALSACSDSTVVGADSQDNSVAEGSSSSVTPGSSNTLPGQSIQGYARTALRSVSQGTAATVFHMMGSSIVEVDSVTAHESYDRTVQSILDYDVTLRVAEFDIKYDTIAMPAFEHPFNSSTYAVMKDENGLTYGEITLNGDVAPLSYSIYCNGEKDIRSFYSVSWGYENDFSGVMKTLRSEDSTLLERFKQDCALENGTLDSADFYIPEIYCTVAPQKVDSDPTYKDPKWKKFATGIAEGCVSTTENIDSYFDWIDL